LAKAKPTACSFWL
jgi:hypothetical protein